MSDAAQNPPPQSGTKPGINQRLGYALQMLGALALALMLAFTAAGWQRPRITAEMEWSLNGSSTSSSQVAPNPRIAGMIVLAAALTIAVGLLLQGRQMSLRRLVVLVFFVGALAAVVSTGVAYAPTQSQYYIECRKPLQPDEIERIAATAKKTALAALPLPRDLVALNAAQNTDTERVIVTLELATTLDDDTAHKVMLLVKETVTATVYELGKLEQTQSDAAPGR